MISRFFSTTASVALILTVILGQPTAARAQESDSNPLLSEEIRTVLEKDGAEEATKRFHALFPAHKEDYEVDQKGFGDLAASLMQNGDFAGGQAVIQMLNAIVEESLAELQIQIPDKSAPAVSGPTKKRAKEPTPVSDTGSATPSLGPARTDLKRFTGVYGTPENVDTGRTLFVAESCDGHLVVGPMWADTSPWWMKSTSDVMFEYRWNETYVQLEFVEGSGGNAAVVDHNLDFMDTPLPRVGPLPEGWRDCIRPSWG